MKVDLTQFQEVHRKLKDQKFQRGGSVPKDSKGYENMIKGMDKHPFEGVELKKWKAKYAIIIYEVAFSDTAYRYALAYAWNNIHGSEEVIVSPPETLGCLDELREKGKKKQADMEERGYEVVHSWGGYTEEHGDREAAFHALKPEPKEPPKPKRHGMIMREDTEW